MATFGKKTDDSSLLGQENKKLRQDSSEKSLSSNTVTSQREALKSFKVKAYAALMERIDLVAASQMQADYLRREVEQFIADFASENSVQINAKEQKQVATSLVDDMIGLGPLEELLDDTSITDILVNGPFDLFVERKGKLERVPYIKFHDEAHLQQIARRIASRVGRRVDESSPMVDARLADGSRVNIIMPPLALNGTTISIRKFSRVNITLNKMVENMNLSKAMASVLKIAAASRLNILISGGTGSGKTTLLNAMSQLIHPSERIVTIEDSAELRLQLPHVVRLESRPPNIEGEGAVTIRDLVKNALRMRPDRIIVGEVRGDETIDMLQAMNTGHDGSMSTIHANRPREALTRLENMLSMSGLDLPLRVVRALIVGAINLIVHTDRMRDGIRRVTDITEITGLEGDVIMTQDLFKFEFQGDEPENAGEAGHIRGTFKSIGLMPRFMTRASFYGFEQELKQAIREDG
ncbi:MAG: CpaF family protein [Alphaproteobacteria bacterium]|nr:CpaF family protein [Alphaproteobacteria bacterium]